MSYLARHLLSTLSTRLSLTCSCGALLLCLAVNSQASILGSTPPAHSVSPELNGLNVTYLVKKDLIKIKLYVINHETFEVLCDAQYSSGPERQDAPEKIIPPNGKADKFWFNYGRHSDSIVIRLICVNPDNIPDKYKEEREQK